ncbi:MAG: MFS transporter [Pyrinomonas sp.]|uniref:MFS transporter n=1 Tax=Pyrinomonas sp. TaxID=2080306 RepID=UPI0033236E0C
MTNAFSRYLNLLSSGGEKVKYGGKAPVTDAFDSGAARALFLSTTAFAISFAVWGLVAALAPMFTQTYKLSATQKSLLIAVPVLLGSLGRLPAGVLADRFGGRRIFTALLALSALPALGLGFSNSYAQLLLFGFFLGIAGTTFPVGVGFISKWFPPERQGFALGIYGMGNIGQSLAVFGAPALALYFGDWRPIFSVFAVVSLLWAVFFYLFARDAVTAARRQTLAENLLMLQRSPLAWVLALFYFLTFGGFVALSIYLPTLLREEFALAPTDAGARTAGFVILATLMRPVGGLFSDRYGGARVLFFVFALLALMGLLMSTQWMPIFTIGALGAASLLGLGNGAVFKLVPQYFPEETGTVTGLVGAFGGLGGFFPPLALGLIRDATGSYALGFILLSLFALGCFAINRFVIMSRDEAARKSPPAKTQVSRQKGESETHTR